MGTVVRFPRHKLYRCGSECEGCCICEGGLASCVTCGGAEASLTIDCCGERLSIISRECIQLGMVDYERSIGWFAWKNGSKFPINGEKWRKR